MTTRSERRQHSGEDLEPEVLFVPEPVRAALQDADPVVQPLDEAERDLWTYVSPAWASRFLDRWCTKTLAAAVEGFNNKARVTTRTAFGFRTYRAMEIALYHTLGALPEPEALHRSC